MLLLGACSTNETFDPVSGPMSFDATGSTSMLSASELKAYLADRSYIQKLAPAGQSTYINHADPRQHSFVLARLKMTGKTPENSPRLFAAIEQLKTVQTAQKLGAGSMLAASATNGAWQSLHVIGPLGNARSGGLTDVMGSAVASRKDSLNYGYVDTTVWDGLGNQIGDLTYYEIFGNMPNHQVVASGSRNFAQDNQIQTDSLMMEIITTTGEMHSSYILGPVIALDPIAHVQSDQTHPQSPSQGAAQTPGPLNAIANPPVVTHPRQIAGVTSPIKICLERSGPDCTYFNSTTTAGQNLTWKVRIPLLGNVGLSAANYVFDAAKIAMLKTGALSVTTSLIMGYEMAGGGCMNAGGMVGPVTATDFWNSVSLSADQRTLTWDMYSDFTKWAKFGESCQLLNTPTYVTMYVDLPYRITTSGLTGLLHVWVSNETDYVCPSAMTPNVVCLPYTPDMTIVNSCLAEGTRVAIDGVTSRKIEDLHLGDKVSNPYATSLTIVDTIAGTELTPMVRIADDKDHELLLTEMHPLYVEGRGMVPAKLLKVGDPMRTDTGPSRLIRVTREDFRGKVYNLKLGNHDEAMKLGVDQTAMYANGFLVGDAQIQDRYQTMETEQLYPKKSDGRLSSRWRKDYQQSLNHAASSPARTR